MPYVTLESDIASLPLSTRSLRALHNGKVKTIKDMMACSTEDLLTIRNLGKKSIDEIQFWKNALCTGTSEYCLVEAKDMRIEEPKTQMPNDPQVSVYVTENGAVVSDIPIEKTSLSNRARNNLRRGGIRFVSQLTGKTLEDIISIKNMGQKTAEEVLKYISSIEKSCDYNVSNPNDITDAMQYDQIASELVTVFGYSKKQWLQEILATTVQYPDISGALLIERLYLRQTVRTAAKNAILRFLEMYQNGLSHDSLQQEMPNHINNTSILSELLHDLSNDGIIAIMGLSIQKSHPSVLQFAQHLPDERMRNVFLARLSGKTLQEIGDQFGITRERVRQLVSRALRKRPILREDTYTYLIEHYSFSKEDFSLAFDEPIETFIYLDLIRKSVPSDRKPIENALTDTVIPPEVRRKIERAVYKNYITIDGSRVKKNRQSMVKHFIKHHCKELTKYDDFLSRYHAQLDALGLSNDSSLIVEARTYENILNQCDYVLWNQWRSFRYYNLSEQDFTELYSTLDFSQYENTEISSLKVFRDYPALMVQYDIHDEYELHNLLKKVWTSDTDHVTFKKMPTIEVGTSNRDNQVLSLLLQYAPISAENLAAKYEESYGVKATTVLANYMGNFDVYYYNGFYTITSKDLPPAQYERMGSVLSNAFYTISDVRRLYLREYPHAEIAMINPYTLKTLGFKVYSGYVIRNTYPSAADYFRELLTTDDIIDARNISRSIQNVVAYAGELYRLRSIYEIVEFLPLQYINIRRLNTVGVTTNSFEKYCKAVAHNYEKGEYFTVTSLRRDGFTHEVDDLGFDEWFYASVLLEDREDFSYQRIGGTRVFLRGKPDANLGDMLVWLLEKYQKIDFYDLKELLENHYGITLSNEKLLTIIGGTELYYDTIMEAVYIDYDTYFEEI